jgi:hypothetical protein
MRTVATAIALLALTASPATAGPRVARDMYGKRYCEYLVVKGQAPDLTAEVWNTFGLNTCPAAKWKTSDATRLAAENDALAVVLNGPRYWLMDRNSITLEPPLGEIRRFSSGLDMRLVASVVVPLANGAPSQQPYHPTAVIRDNVFTWSRRHRVYELVDPDGHVYVMQTYSQIVDPRLGIAQLRKLGPQLKLPAGWRYRTRRISRDLAIDSRGRAVVVQDGLQNTYQRLR